MSLASDKLGHHQQNLVVRSQTHFTAHLLDIGLRDRLWPVDVGIDPDPGHIANLVGGNEAMPLCRC